MFIDTTLFPPSAPGEVAPTAASMAPLPVPLTPHRCSMSSRVASFTLDASHSQPFTTTIVVWKFFCFWRKVSCTLYCSWIAFR